MEVYGSHSHTNLYRPLNTRAQINPSLHILCTLSQYHPDHQPQRDRENRYWLLNGDCPAKKLDESSLQEWHLKRQDFGGVFDFLWVGLGQKREQNAEKLELLIKSCSSGLVATEVVGEIDHCPKQFSDSIYIQFLVSLSSFSSCTWIITYSTKKPHGWADGTYKLSSQMLLRIYQGLLGAKRSDTY